MLYAFGSNGSGQLGVGHCEDLSEPTAIATDAGSTWRLKQLAAGGNHSVLLCDDGKLRAADTNGVPRTVKQIATNWSATTLLCEDGAVYTCGTGSSGELGLGPGATSTKGLWQRVSAFPPPGTSVIFIASGMAHTVAILSNHEVYGWGKGRKGQLGEPADEVWWPRKITGIEFGATEAVCGKDFTFVVGEKFTGEIAVLGPVRNDRFGLRASAPVWLSGWESVAATWGSIFALKASGDVIAWGRDDHGQLPPQGLPEIAAIAAGSEHCLALTRAGKALVWGWGEHGNCGRPTGERGDVKQGWNEIEVAGRVSKVFAGCATSFIEVDDEQSGVGS